SDVCSSDLTRRACNTARQAPTRRRSTRIVRSMILRMCFPQMPGLEDVAVGGEHLAQRRDIALTVGVARQSINNVNLRGNHVRGQLRATVHANTLRDLLS